MHDGEYRLLREEENLGSLVPKEQQEQSSRCYRISSQRVWLG